MAQNNDLDPKLKEQLRQHYSVNPRSGFLPELKNDLLGHFHGQQPIQLIRHKFAFALIAAVLVLVIVLFATPIGDALAQEFVELFSRAESNAIPLPPAQTLIAGTATAEYLATNSPDYVINRGYEATIGPDSVLTDVMILSAVERAAEYDIYEPAYLPENFELVGTSFDPDTGIVRLTYNHLNVNDLTLDQEPVSGLEDCDLCSELAPSTAISIIQIGDLEGEYVIGGWEQDNGNKFWNADPYLQTLRWESDDVVFILSYQGNPEEMTESEMILIAKDLVTRVPEPASIIDANMTIEEIEEAAGFDVLVPTQIASIFQFTGGSYLPEENMTLLFYDLMGRSTNGLRIAQEPVTGTEDCDLCSEIGPAANIQSVQIGDVPGELVTGVWELKDGYQIWRNEPWVVRMRWQTNDTVFELSFFGPPGTMTKSSMVRVAESMTSSNEPLIRYSVTPTPAATQATLTPDPSKSENADMTIAEVEQAAGFGMLPPTYLANREFYGANYDPITNTVYLFYQGGLTIRQESFVGIADCDLCAEVKYSAVSRFTEFGDIVAEFLIDAKLTKLLRWQDGNMFFEISYRQDPSELNLDDLIQIAESLQ